MNPRVLLLGSLLLAATAACSDDETSGSGGGGAGAASTSTGTGTSSSSSAAQGGGTGQGGGGGEEPGSRPHPLYPSLDLDTLPGDGGAISGAYEPPELPTTTRTVTVSTTGATARTDLLAACQTPGTAVTVPDGAGNLGVLDFGNVEDCDVTLGATVVTPMVYVGHLPGPQVAPTHRIRIRGGQIGQIVVDPGSTDVVFDGVTVNNAVVPPAERSSTGIYLIGDDSAVVERFAFVNSVLRMVATLPDGSGNTDGCAYLAGGARDVFFANDNVVTDGNRNAWGFRIGGGDNFLIVDSSVRVSFHKLIRMNDGPVDYVYVKGGTWMREATLTAGGLEINDSFAQLGDLGTDSVYIHDPAVHLLSSEPVGFGMSTGPGQAGKRWEARRIAWHATSASVVSDALLASMAGFCDAAADCDYGVGTHTYDYDANIAFPANPWRSLPGLAEDDPDALPIAN